MVSWLDGFSETTTDNNSRVASVGKTAVDEGFRIPLSPLPDALGQQF